MSIFETLTREHRIMGGLAAKVELALRLGDDGAGRRGLLVLCQALALHEEIEDLVVEPAGRDPSPELARALCAVALQHAEILSLRDEARELLARTDEDSPRLTVLSFTLARRLRAHFQTEEARLWPVLAAGVGRSVERSLARRALKGVDELERKIRELERKAVERP